MNVLSIETSTTVCSVAICSDGICIAEHTVTDGNNHAAVLPAYIQKLLSDRNDLPKIDAVAVSEGPGSYTGLRIGMSTAKGLCYGWNIPLISVPTLDILCQSAINKYPNMSGILLPMLDARRMEVYTGMYRYTNDKLITICPTTAKIVEDTAWLPQESPIYYFGDGADKCRAILNGDNYHYMDGVIPHAAVMGQLIIQQDYPTIGIKEVAYHTPFYLKEFIAAPSHIKGLH